MSDQVYSFPVVAQTAPAQAAPGGCEQDIEMPDYSLIETKVVRESSNDNDIRARNTRAGDFRAGDSWAGDFWVGRARLYCESGVFHCHADSPAALTPAELALLKVFHDRPGQILDRDQLSELSLGRKWEPWNRCIDNHVSHLRRKIGNDPMEPGLIRTIRGKGYVYMP